MKARSLLWSFLVFLMGVACAGIGLALYPLMKKYSTGLAIGVVGFRVAEGILEILGGVLTIGLLALSQEFVKASASGATYFQTIGAIIKAGDAWLSNGAVLLLWCIGALMYYARLLSIPACPALALRLGVGWHYLGHHRRRTGHAPCHPRFRYRADASQSADIPAGDGLGGLADRKRIQSIGSRFSVCENSDERAFERGIDLHIGEREG
jgi:hypothetical protein